MRIEPKMYESTKPEDATVDTTVVEADIAYDGFLDMVNGFFQKIYAFLKWNFSADVEMNDRGYGYTDWDRSSDEHESYEYGYGFKPGFGFGYGYGASFDDGH